MKGRAKARRRRRSWRARLRDHLIHNVYMDRAVRGILDEQRALDRTVGRVAYVAARALNRLARAEESWAQLAGAPGEELPA